MTMLLVNVDNTTGRRFYENRHVIHPDIAVLIVRYLHKAGIGRQDATYGNIAVIGDGIGRVFINIGNDRLLRIDFTDTAKFRVTGVRLSLNA